MRSLLATLTRFMPLMFLIIVAIAVIQFFSQHPIGWHDVAHFIRGVVAGLVSGFRYVLAVAVLLWIIVWLGVRHERRCSSTLNAPRRRTWRMDILDRLTDRPDLEGRLREEAEPTYVDAEAL